ncbi:TetR/AcrR family transcriptional regulator [Noviherbaspirillum denitrificans]|uniref:Transcriptional regulator n=1 Tax=Noviherbaspirillum denitrificans TaxID=1968433 RepID=A0A254T8W1_9BURK|nr:TetR/AcrR family transcriptional regulator [Noviherbaspirillum denitrificans]OWW19015.1 transcriptional regulator [Noviherbaspirillum denitrificans]
MPPKVYTSVDDEKLVEKRREQFVAAASELFGRNGFHTTTIKEIAQRAGVSAGLIYAYVKTKEDILFLVLQSVLEGYAREIPKALEGMTDPLQRFCTAVRTYCEVVAAKPDATLLAYRETKSLSSEQKAAIKDMELASNRLISDCIDACIRAGYFRPAKNLELLTYRIVLLAHGWALKAWRFREIVSLDEYIAEEIDMFLHAMMTDAGWNHFRGMPGRAVNTK